MLSLEHPQRLRALRQYVRPRNFAVTWHPAQLLFNGLAVVVTKAKGLILIIVLGHVLGVGGLGTWTQAYVLNTLLSILAGMGLFNGIVRSYPQEQDDDRRRLLWTSLFLVATTGVLLGLVALVASPWTAQQFGGDGSRNAFRLASALVPLTAVRLLLLNISRARDRLSVFSGATIASDALELALVVTLLVVTGSVTGAIAGSVAALLIACIALAFVNRAAFGRPCRPSGGRRYLAYSLPIVPIQLSDDALARGDRLIIGALLGPGAAGVYSALYALANVINITSVPITNVLFPKIVRIGRSASKRALARVGLLFSAFATIQVFVLALIAGWASTVLLGDEQPWLRSFTVVLLVGGGVVFFGFGRILSLELFRDGRTVAALGVWGGAALFNALLNFPLVSMYGIVGAAAASFVAYGLFLLLQVQVFTGRPLRAVRGQFTSPAPAGVEPGVHK